MKRLTVFSLLLLLRGMLFAQSNAAWAVSEIPDSLLKNAKSVVRDELQTFTVSAPDKAVLEINRTVTLISEDDSEQEFYVHYDKNSRVTDLEVEIFDALGRFLRKFSKDELTDRSAISNSSIYEDSRVKQLKINHLDYPFTMNVRYRVKYDGLQGYPASWFQKFGQSCRRAAYRVTVPPEISIRYSTNVPGLRPLVSTEKNGTTWLWAVKNLPVILDEPFAPPGRELLPHVLVAPSVFRMENWSGSMTDWAAFGKFQTELNAGRDELGPEMALRVKRMAATSPENRDKIANLYRFLQENHRYVSVQLGIGGWQTFDAAYVEKNKFGDCKALTNYMKAMLRTVEIEAFAAAVSAGETDFFDPKPDFVNPSFNHVVLFIPSEKMWLECTSRNAPCGYASSFTDGRKALVFRGSESQLLDIPTLTAGDNRQENIVAVSLLASGEAAVSVESVRTGEEQDDFRNAKGHYEPAEFDQYFRENYPLNFTVLEKTECRPDARLPETRLSLAGKLRTFATKSGTRLFVPVNAHNAFRNPLPAAEKRVHPLVLHRTFTQTDSVRIEMPEGFQVENLPKEVRLETEFGSLEMSVKNEQGVLVCRRRLVVLPVRAAAERYGEVRDFYKKVEAADAGKAVLVLKKS